jgi:hypothetical protein
MGNLASALGGFNASQVEPTGSFDALPAGEYEVAIVDSEMRDTAAGDGQYLQLELKVMHGPHANRKLWDRLNLINPKEKAVQIAKGTLSAICRAVGVLTPNDSSELHGRRLIAVVGQYEYQGKQRNEVRGYKAKTTTTRLQTEPSQKLSPNAVRRDGNDDNEIPF